MSTIINLSGYLFKPLSDLDAIRAVIKPALRAISGLKGTILLTPEGVNAFLAGTREDIETGKSLLYKAIGEKFPFKESESTKVPFNRLLVKIKQETIVFSVDSFNMFDHPAPYVSPKDFDRWIAQGHDDDNRELIILDTRNDYEYHVGSFKNAIVLPLKTFRAFPEIVDTFPETWKEKTIVSFCTGGIRCEKAAPYLCYKGFHAYQLDGGILKYFEDCGQSNWSGECFVFDDRVALNANLEETTTVQCYACRMPVPLKDQDSPLYAVGKHCPWCHTDGALNRIDDKQEGIHHYAN